MRRIHYSITAITAAIFCLSVFRIAHAYESVIYLGEGKTLAAKAPRQITYQANITFFEYQPGGYEIAYIRSTPETDPPDEGGGGGESVCSVGVRSGRSTTLIDSSSAHDTALLGWSGDAQYLLVRQREAAQTESAEGIPGHIAYLCVDAAATPPHVRTLPIDDPYNGYSLIPDAERWSPERTRILLTFRGYSRTNTAISPKFVFIYSPVLDRLDLLNLGSDNGLRIKGWYDESSLLLTRKTDKGQAFSHYDLATGKETPLTSEDAAKVVLYPDLTLSPKNPDLVLTVESHPISSGEDEATIIAKALWVRHKARTKLYAALPIGLTSDENDPLATWSPAGDQIAYLSHGDLFVADLVIDDASPQMKSDIGEPLTCEEQQTLATTDAKKIGLGILQYTQDYDEKFPPADKFHDSVLPYLQDARVYRFGPNHFAYVPPKGMTIASIDSAATQILGTYDTVCSHVVLYCDGHVKAFPKQ